MPAGASYAVLRLTELVHRHRKQWSERKVRQAEQRLFARLTRADIDTLYGIYLGVVKHRKMAKVL